MFDANPGLCFKLYLTLLDLL